MLWAARVPAKSWVSGAAPEGELVSHLFLNHAHPDFSKSPCSYLGHLQAHD